jgi:lantibiotic modifying enzyme
MGDSSAAVPNQQAALAPGSCGLGCLVLGYRGTLGPDPVPGGVTAAERSDPAELSPPWVEAFLEPLLAEAIHKREGRVPAAHRIFAGEPIPFDGLTGVLRERLEGIVIQAMGAWCLATQSDRSPIESSFGRDLPRVFPVLAQLLHRAMADWVEATAIFAERLHRDVPQLAAWLGVNALPPLASVSGTNSDLHPGGHLALRVEFRGGVCIYYKPRPVTGEWLWHRLLAAIAAADPDLRLPAARALAGSGAGRNGAGQYGWAESVLACERGPEESTQEFAADSSSYWHQAGASLCLAEHVRLADLHLGNVLATANGPAVTDAECLGSPQGPAPVGKSGSRPGEVGAVLDSLLETGLLPRGSPDGLPDTSGLFGGAEAVPGLELLRWAPEPEGRYRLTAVPARLLDHSNTPAQTSPLTVLPHILRGYRHAAEALLATRKSLLAPDSVWRAVLQTAHAPRAVLRETLTFGLLLSQSLEPASLRSMHRRRTSLLGALRAKSEGRFPAALLRAETQALVNLHVPRLVTLPGTRTLATGAGRSLVRKWAACTPAEAVVRAMEELSAERLESTNIPALLLAVLGERRA